MFSLNSFFSVPDLLQIHCSRMFIVSVNLVSLSLCFPDSHTVCQSRLPPDRRFLAELSLPHLRVPLPNAQVHVPSHVRPRQHLDSFHT